MPHYTRLSATTFLLCLLSVLSLVSRSNAATKATVYSTCKNAGQIALTFDDGPYTTTKRVQQTFDNNGVKASFFMNGYNWDCIWDFKSEIKARFNKGHFLASHTWSHVDLTTLNDQDLNEQFQLVEDFFAQVMNIRPLYFRPPYGSINDHVLEIAAKRGYKGAILWNYDSGDSTDPHPTAKQIINGYHSHFTSTSQKSISLNHDFSNEFAPSVIPDIVPYLKGKGFKLVTVGECIGAGADPSKWYVKVTPRAGIRQTCDGTPEPGEN